MEQEEQNFVNITMYKQILKKTYQKQNKKRRLPKPTNKPNSKELCVWNSAASVGIEKLE